jgi:hypothetical protein
MDGPGSGEAVRRNAGHVNDADAWNEAIQAVSDAGDQPFGDDEHLEPRLEPPGDKGRDHREEVKANPRRGPGAAAPAPGHAAGAADHGPLRGQSEAMAAAGTVNIKRDLRQIVDQQEITNRLLAPRQAPQIPVGGGAIRPGRAGANASRTGAKRSPGAPDGAAGTPGRGPMRLTPQSRSRLILAPGPGPAYHRESRDESETTSGRGTTTRSSVICVVAGGRIAGCRGRDVAGELTRRVSED